MTKRLILLLAIALSALALPAFSAQETDAASAPAGTRVKYKEGKALDFEALLVNGRFQRPELSVVTGDTRQGGDGLLRLRENFVDRMTNDLGENEP